MYLSIRKCYVLNVYVQHRKKVWKSDPEGGVRWVHGGRVLKKKYFFYVSTIALILRFDNAFGFVSQLKLCKMFKNWFILEITKERSLPLKCCI